ncbi:MAG: MBOAT family O-acyltransferase [Myxococcota bacterium]
MLFHSLEFVLLFLPLCVLGFQGFGRLGPGPARLFLLAASLVFYGVWDWRYLALLGTSLAVNHGLGQALQRTRSRGLLTLGILANLGSIAYFKYADFFLDTVNQLGGSFELLHIVLPLGISFFTFQQISYLVETWRGEVACRDFTEYALFITFFPQLIAGPIVRFGEIVPQLREDRFGQASSPLLAAGAFMFVIGLSKKVLLADPLAALASPAFAVVDAGLLLDPVEAWVGLLAYAFQIYFDFSGYSDMAIGLGLMFGVDIPANFDAPYTSTSIVEFWRRWHITLSSFLRDYLYLPLGGNRLGRVRRYANLSIVMLLGGLWHGASWNFVIWGGLHGLYLMVNHAWRHVGGRREPSTLGTLGWGGLTFLSVCVAWVFFRAETLGGALRMLQSLAGTGGPPDAVVLVLSLMTAAPALVLAGAITWRAPTSIELLRRFREAPDGAPPDLWRPVAMGVLLATSLFLVFAGAHSEFIYFQF